MENLASNPGGNTPDIQCHPALSVLSQKMSLLGLKYVSNLNDVPIWVIETLRNGGDYRFSVQKWLGSYQSRKM